MFNGTIDIMGDCIMYWVPDLIPASLSVQETIQKALRMVDESSLGFDPIRYLLLLLPCGTQP